MNAPAAAVSLLAASNWGLAIGIVLVMLVFLVVGYVVVQGTRVQLAWRERVEAGDVDAIQSLVADEINRWKTQRMPKAMDTSVWHGVQSAELLEVSPDSIRLSASAEGQYALISGERREISGALREGMKLTAKLADMVFYDIPNVRLPRVRIDIYSTFRGGGGAMQCCILTTECDRAIGSDIDWDDTDPEEIVRAFGGRYALDDRGNPTPVEVDAPARNSVPAVFYTDEEKT